MTWQQILILVWLLFSTAMTVHAHIKDKTWSSWATTGWIFFTIALSIGYALVLHSGRFW